MLSIVEGGGTFAGTLGESQVLNTTSNSLHIAGGSSSLSGGQLLRVGDVASTSCAFDAEAGQCRIVQSTMRD